MKRMMVVLTTVLLIAALSGAMAAAQTVTLTFWGWIGPEWIETYREFERQHPNIKIKESLISQEWASSSEKFLAAMAAGNAPDISVQNSHQFAQWASQGPFLDIRPYAERDGVVRDDWFASQWDGTFFNGRQFALPGVTDVRLFYWNKDHYREAGLDPEVPPATWDELEAVTAKVTKRDNSGRITQFGFLPYYGNTWTWLYGWLNGGEFVDETGRIITCDDPRIVYALDWMVNFYNEYCGGAQLAASFIEGFQAAAQDPFVSEKLSMVGNGNWMLWNFATFPDLDYGAAPMPIPDTGTGVKTTWSCGSYYAISANTKHPEEAWTFIKWLSGPEGAKAYAAALLKARTREWERQQLPGSPVYVPELFNSKLAMKALEEEYLGALPPKVQAEYQLTIDALSWTHSCTEMGLVGLTYWNEMHAATEAAMYGKMTAKEALEQCRIRVQQALDEAWELIKVK